MGHPASGSVRRGWGAGDVLAAGAGVGADCGEAADLVGDVALGAAVLGIAGISGALLCSSSS